MITIDDDDDYYYYGGGPPPAGAPLGHPASLCDRSDLSGGSGHRRFIRFMVDQAPDQSYWPLASLTEVNCYETDHTLGPGGGTRRASVTGLTCQGSGPRVQGLSFTERLR